MENMGAQPVYNVGEGSNDIMGGGGLWVFFLFFLLAWGGNGFGGNSANGGGQISNDFLYTNLNNDLNTDFIQVYQQNQAMAKDLCTGFSNVNSNLNNGFSSVNSNLNQGFNTTNMAMINATNGINSNINTISREMSDCCCATNRNIDSVKFENERNTNAIIQNASANNQAILDKLCANEIQELRDKLNESQRLADIAAQNAYLVNQIRPFPMPSYTTCSPYTSGCANAGCGC